MISALAVSAIMPRFSLDSDDHSENDSPGSFSSNDNHPTKFSSKLSMQNDCAIGHRVQASRSVLAVALDEECVFAGLQGGDILVCHTTHTLPENRFTDY